MGRPAGELFEGLATGMPVPMARSIALYRQASRPEPKVKHVQGYERFVEFCARRGVQPAMLAADPGRLFWFLRSIGAEIQNDSALRAAAGVFVGNTLARLRADAVWRAYEGGAPTVGDRHKQFEVDRLLEALRTADDAAVQGFVAVVLDWAGEKPEEPPNMRPRPSLSPAPTAYVRPVLPETTYYSDDGSPIPYGRQWGEDGPDPESYSVDSHPERFAPLHIVARALIDYLVAAYDVDVDENPVHETELLRDIPELLQTVKITPRRHEAAALTFVLTRYPGVVIHAGVLHDFPFPVCGCDACDETAQSTAERMERLVLSVAAGGYTEHYPLGSRRWSRYLLTAFDGSGSESGEGEPARISEDRLQEAEVRLRDVTDGWSQWPARRY